MRKLTEIEAEVPSGTLGPTEVQILDYGEMDIRRPDGKPVVRRSIPPRHRRSLVVGGAIALSLVAAWAVFQPHSPAANALSSQRPIAVASASATVPATASWEPSATPTPAPTIRPTQFPLPVPLGGWVVEAEDGSKAGLGPKSPDGTIYVFGMAPIDANGVSRPDWLRLPDGSHLLPQAFGPDGSAFGAVQNADGSGTLWAFGPDHQLRYSIQMPTFSFVNILPRPDLGVYAFAGTFNENGEFDGFRVLSIDRGGWLNADWPLGDSATHVSQFLVRDDGALLTQYEHAGRCALHVFNSLGAEIGKPITSCWDSIVPGPNGRFVGESYVRSSEGAVTQTRIAVLGQNGASLAGWPRTILGTVSLPSFGIDGGLYFSYFTPDGSRWLTVLEPNGKTRSGLPVMVEGSNGPFDSGNPAPAAPVLGDGDVTYDASTSGVTAWDRRGQRVITWHVAVEDPLVSLLFVRAPGEPGLLGVVAGRTVTLLNPDGSSSRQFSDPSPGFLGWAGWAVARNGLVGVETRTGVDGNLQMLVIFVPATVN